MSNRGTETDDVGDAGSFQEHLRDIPDGAGCTEIWEQLSKQRDRREDD